MPHNPYNILYLSSFGTLERGGQNSLFELVIRLDRTRFRPIVMMPEEGDLKERLENEGIETIILNLPPIVRSNPVTVFLRILELIKIVTRERISLIHTDNVRNTLYSGVVSKLRGISSVWHIRVSKGNALIDVFLSMLVDMIITVSHEGRNRFSGVDSRKITTIYNAVDLDKFDPNVQPAVIDMVTDKGSDDIFVGEIGEISERKAQGDLIKAVNKISRECQNIQLIFVGGKDGKYYEQLVELVRLLKLNDRVTFLNYRDDIPHIISLLDIVVLPSLLEGLPRIIIEAMSCGKPVIASDISGNRELVIEGETGYLYPVRNVHALAEKLKGLVQNEHKRILMGENARRMALKRFDIKKQVVQIERLYTSLISEKN